MKRFLGFAFLLLSFAGGCNSNNNTVASEKTQTSTKKKSDLSGLADVNIENLNASNKMRDIICQSWENKEDAADAKDMDPSSIEMVYRGYCLFNDGTLIKDPRGDMQTGKWELDETVKPIILKFNFNSGEKENWQLAYLMPYKMKLAKPGGKYAVMDLGSEAFRHMNLEDDPFYISNNAWRFKPTKQETDEQIRTG